MTTLQVINDTKDMMPESIILIATSSESWRCWKANGCENLLLQYEGTSKRNSQFLIMHLNNILYRIIYKLINVCTIKITMTVFDVMVSSVISWSTNGTLL